MQMNLENIKNIQDRRAYSEVLEVLKYLPLEEYNKIPKEVIEFLRANYDEKSGFQYNLALPFEEQDLSHEAKRILRVIINNYTNKS